MVVIEGPDGSGKTTLCNRLLAEGFVSKVLPSPRIPANKNAERMKYETDRYLKLYGDNNTVAVDRYLFSEVVYGKILRGKSVFSQAEYMNKLIQLMMAGSIVIFCMPNKLIFKEKENPQVIEKQEEIKAGYQNAIRDQAFTSERTYVYRWDDPEDFTHLTSFLERFEVTREVS
jgi:thymidylate kinase